MLKMKNRNTKPLNVKPTNGSQTNTGNGGNRTNVLDVVLRQSNLKTRSVLATASKRARATAKLDNEVEVKKEWTKYTTEHAISRALQVQYARKTLQIIKVLENRARHALNIPARIDVLSVALIVVIGCLGDGNLSGGSFSVNDRKGALPEEWIQNAHNHFNAFLRSWRKYLPLDMNKKPPKKAGTTLGNVAVRIARAVCGESLLNASAYVAKTIVPRQHRENATITIKDDITIDLAEMPEYEKVFDKSWLASYKLSRIYGNRFGYEAVRKLYPIAYIIMHEFGYDIIKSNSAPSFHTMVLLRRSLKIPVVSMLGHLRGLTANDAKLIDLEHKRKELLLLVDDYEKAWRTRFQSIHGNKPKPEDLSEVRALYARAQENDLLLSKTMEPIEDAIGILEKELVQIGESIYNPADYIVV